MSPSTWAAALAQVDPVGPVPATPDDGMRVILGLLVAAIAALATVITILWRRGERRNDRQIRAMEEALVRETARGDTISERLAAEREAFAELLGNERTAFLQALDKQRADLATLAAADRAEFGATLRGILERQLQTDAKLTEGISRVGQVLEERGLRTPRKG